MSDFIAELSTGDKVYLYDKSLVVFFQGPRKVLSTSVFNGGYHEDYEAIFNNDGKQGSGMPCEMLADTYIGHMHELCKRLALDSTKVTGMSTAASMENAIVKQESYKNLTVTAVVTGGVETNGGRVGDPTNYFHPIEKPGKPGTINIMLFLDCDMPPGTLTRALVTCTEAKTAALQELLAGSNYSNGIATGSGTDQTIIVANPTRDLYLEGAGKHDKMGELIGNVVKHAVKAALAKQSNTTPERQHNAFRRLKRFGITPEVLWKHYKEQHYNALKPEFLLPAEALAQQDMLVTYTSLYVHLLDQHLWELISLEELYLAGENILRLIAEHYDIEFCFTPPQTTDDWSIMLDYWQELFILLVINYRNN